MPGLKDIVKELFDTEETKEEVPTEAETPSGLLEVLKEVFTASETPQAKSRETK